MDGWAGARLEDGAVQQIELALEMSPLPFDSARTQIDNFQEYLDTVDPVLKQPEVTLSDARKQLERIHHLERALDQSMASLEEMRRQLADQDVLEMHLAATEEAANIQKQAINQLQQQLVQQQQRLEEARSHYCEQIQSLQAQLTTREAVVQSQSIELERLHHQLNQNHLEANAEIDWLSKQLDDRQTAIQQLETDLHHAHVALQEQHALIDQIQQAPPISLAELALPADAPLPTEEAIAALKELSPAQASELQLARQRTAQAMLQHTCQELEQSSQQQQARIAELESQAADMQEQILQQAQQASEYEAAIQHWKDRYLKAQQHEHHLTYLMTQALTLAQTDPSCLLPLLESILNNMESDRAATPTPNPLGSKPDLPDFLIRRQRKRVRS